MLSRVLCAYAGRPEDDAQAVPAVVSSVRVTTRRQVLIALGAAAAAGCITPFRYRAPLQDGVARVPLAELARLGADDVMVVRVPGVAHDLVVRRAGDGLRGV